MHLLDISAGPAGQVEQPDRAVGTGRQAFPTSLAAFRIHVRQLVCGELDQRAGFASPQRLASPAALAASPIYLSPKHIDLETSTAIKNASSSRDDGWNNEQMDHTTGPRAWQDAAAPANYAAGNR